MFNVCRFYSERRHERCFLPFGHKEPHFWEKREGKERKMPSREEWQAFKRWKRENLKLAEEMMKGEM